VSADQGRRSSTFCSIILAITILAIALEKLEDQPL
jgi:hypothetical protein